MKTVNILDFFKALLMCQSVISSIFGQMLLLIFSLPHPFSDHPWFLLSCNKSEKNISMKISKITYDQMSRKLHLHRRCFYKIVIMHRFHIMAITVILYLLESGLSKFLTTCIYWQKWPSNQQVRLFFFYCHPLVYFHQKAESDVLD